MADIKEIQDRIKSVNDTMKSVRRVSARRRESAGASALLHGEGAGKSDIFLTQAGRGIRRKEENPRSVAT